MPTRDDIVAAARECVGTPYRDHGDRVGPDGGLDCDGMIIAVAHRVGLALDYQHPAHARFPARSEVARELDRMMDRVHGGLPDARDSDVVLLEDSGWAMHTGILASQGPMRTLIHASNRVPRKVQEHILDVEWARQVRGVWRFRGLD